MYVYVSVYVFMYVWVCVYTYIHIRTHTHTHAYMWNVYLPSRKSANETFEYTQGTGQPGKIKKEATFMQPLFRVELHLRKTVPELLWVRKAKSKSYKRHVNCFDNLTTPRVSHVEGGIRYWVSNPNILLPVVATVIKSCSSGNLLWAWHSISFMQWLGAKQTLAGIWASNSETARSSPVPPTGKLSTVESQNERQRHQHSLKMPAFSRLHFHFPPRW